MYGMYIYRKLWLSYTGTYLSPPLSPKGGYLGELVQWSDLIAGLHMLHHNLTVVTSMNHLKSLVPLTEGKEWVGHVRSGRGM